MKLNEKYRLLVPLTFSAYFLLAVLILDPFVFLEDFSFIPSLAIITIVPLLSGIGLIKLEQSIAANSLRYLTLVAGIMFISILCGTIVLLMNENSSNDLLLYFNSYLLIPVLPISIYILWILYGDLNNRVLLVSENTEVENTVTQQFKITDLNNQVLVEIPVNRIIVFAANDNYVTIHYFDDEGTVQKQMHRISLKKITELLNEIDFEFLRVHKSYLINPNWILKRKGKAQSYRIEMQQLSLEIPVSRSFNIDAIGI